MEDLSGFGIHYRRGPAVHFVFKTPKIRAILFEKFFKFTRHLKTLKPKFIKAERKGIVKIQSNKMQLWSLWVGIAITKRVNEREKGRPLWKIGWEFNLRSIQKAFPVLEEKIDPDATQNLGADVWRQTKRINQIAEAAARGIFPSAIKNVKA